MTDYLKASGEGDLMIRDLGSTVEFWVKPYYSSFWWENLSFSVTANGSTTNYSIDISGNSWKKVASKTISSTQTVTFKLNTATGTSSLGGPTTFSKTIDRATIPPTPDAPTFSNKTSTSLTAKFTDNGNGGASLDDWAISISTTTVQGYTYYTGSDHSQNITGLTPGQKYYFWSRVHNSKGWSNWSARSETTMLRVPYPATNLKAANVTQNAVDISFSDGANGGSAITDRDIAYNTSNTLVGATIISSDGSTTVSNLLPGRQYYFWARSNNAVGDGDWSASLGVLLVAGASVISGGVAKRAVPWVNSGGVWKVAKPWGRIAGYWSESEL